MKEYFISLLAVGLLSMLVNALCHDDKNSVSKNVRLLCALAVICVVVAPIKTFIVSLSASDFSFDSIREGENASEYEDKYREALELANEEAIKQNIENMLVEKFEINPEYIRVTIQTDRSSSTPKLVKITVILSKTAIFENPYNIEKAVTDIYNCECDVAIE